MKICRYDDDRVGLVRDGQVYDASAALGSIPALRWPVPLGDALVANLNSLRPELEHAAACAGPQPLAAVRLQSPVANPSKIVAAPVNYQKHFDEVRVDQGLHHGQEVKPIARIGLFLKAVSSLVGAGHGVNLRFLDRRNDHEVELAVVIGTRADRVSRERALEHVAGYAIALDMTVRGPEERSMRKSVDSYSVLGPWLVTADEIPNPGELDIEIRVNGEVRQSSNTRNLIFDVPKLIELASSFYTLHPGDIIMTGTPDGVGPVAPGDRLEARIQSIGSMQVAVHAA
jgi:2-keto-4-pentenoate hydratase/2-oxohepta-3-ene-1,7-dioic acid hydratase in catechol pathway